MKLKHVSRISASCAVLMGLWGTSFGCLEDAGPTAGMGGNLGTGASGGSSGGGAGGGGGTGATMAMGGMSGGGMGGMAMSDPATPLLDAQCQGIRNNMTCPLIGTCSARSCGIADIGRRDCVCNTTWACTSCAFDETSLPSVLIPPGAGGDADAGDAGDAGGGDAVRTCEAGVIDEALCTQNDRCFSANELCVCFLQNDDGAYIWDCDAIPAFWRD